MGACGGRASGGGGGEVLPRAAPGVEEGSSTRRRGSGCVRTSGERAGHTPVCPPPNLMSLDSLFLVCNWRLAPTHLETAGRCGDEAVIFAAAVPDYARRIQTCGRRALSACKGAR